MQSFRRWEARVSPDRDKIPDDLQVLHVSGLKSGALMDYKTTVVGVRNPGVDVRGSGYRLLLTNA
jgi:hypothetical protein